MLFESTVKADLAGQLLIRNNIDRRIQLADFRREPPFLDKPWDEAIAYFRNRGIVDPNELSTLLRGYAQRADVARLLMLKQIQQEVRAQLEKSLTEGGTYQEFARALADGKQSLGITNADPAYLKMVFRTNVVGAYGAGRFKAILDPVVLAERPFVQYRTVGDARVRHQHELLDGTVYKAESEEWRRVAPPNSYNCFPGFVEVQGTFHTAIRARYSGQLLKFTTKAGRRLSVTPNHPLLTPNGFVAAASLRQGDHVVAHNDRIEPAMVGHVDPQNAPVQIEEVFGALAIRNGEASVNHLRPVATDLHGDAEFCDGEIDVVLPNRELLSNVKIARAQAIGDGVLATPLLAATYKDCGCSLHDLCVCPVASDGRLPSTSTLSLNQGPVELHSGPLHELRFGLAADVNASRYETSSSGGSADSEFLRTLILRHPGVVEIDEIISVNSEFFHGFVYDLESPYGWIVSNGIFASNCRCSIVTLERDDPETAKVREAPPADYVADPDFDRAPTARIPISALNKDEQTEVKHAPIVQVPEKLQPTFTVPRTSTGGVEHGTVERQILGAKQSDANLRELLGFDRAKLPPGFTSSVKGVVEIADYTTPKGTKVAGNVKVKASIKNADGDEVGEIERTYRKDGDKVAVEHTSFFLDESVQGSGIGREIFNAQIDNYERLGNISRVDLTAAQVGKYVWTKAGFEWSDVADFNTVKGELAEALTKQVGATASKEILEAVKTPSDIARLVVDGEKVGKNLLIAREEYIDMSQVPSKIKRL